jgi:hypothetical protein
MSGHRVPCSSWRNLTLAAGMLALVACRTVQVNPSGCRAGPTGSVRRASPAAYVQRTDGRPGVISGDVRDDVTGAALRGASVQMQPGGWQATTDSSGAFRFDAVGVGPLTVSAGRYDHAGQSVRVLLDAGTGVDIAFQLASNRCDGSVGTGELPVRKPGLEPRIPPPRIP